MDKYDEVFEMLDASKADLGASLIELSKFTDEELKEAIALRSCYDDDGLVSHAIADVLWDRDHGPFSSQNIEVVQVFEVEQKPRLSFGKKVIIGCTLAYAGAWAYVGVRHLIKKHKNSKKE